MRVIEQTKILELLKRFKIPTATIAVVKTKKELLKAIKKAKYPLALKLDSPDIIHKTEASALKLSITSAAELEKAYDDLDKAAKLKKAKIAGFSLQSMESGHEVIIGAKRDSTFGHAIMFGLGGIFVEIMKDTSLRIVPVNKKQALAMIREIKMIEILEGARGKQKANLNAIADIIVNLSKLVEKNRQIAEIDLNPVIVNEKTARVVDARMMADEKR